MAEQLKVPTAADVISWPASDPDVGRKCGEICQKDDDNGEVGVAILNRSLATRFGRLAKGVVEVVDNLIFLALELRDVAAKNTPVPISLMNSCATDGDIQDHFKVQNFFNPAPERVYLVQQASFMRLTPEGELFRDGNGNPPLSAPGHGDLLTALSASRASKGFGKHGGKYITVSNVDKLGATLEAKVIGADIRYCSVEMATREGGDTGGTPAWRNGKLELIEGFRFPKSVATDSCRC